MSFIEFDETTCTKQSMIMPSPHSHDHYELYFLLEGERDFFVDNKMFLIPKNTLVIVPPYVMHKTEGGPYRRININISPELLTDNQNNFLLETSNRTALKISDDYLSLITRLLEEGVKLPVNARQKKEALITITKTIITFLSLQTTMSIEAASMAYSPTNVSPEVLKIVYHINKNFTSPITLKSLCDEFFICKVSLCKKFKSVMHCSIMEYILQLRLNKAKALLKEGDKSIEEIASLCGFSSANYFGLIFKKAIGLSPLNYKKTR